jgi:hypothetical protein
MERKRFKKIMENWIKKLITQAVRDCFEIWINVWGEIRYKEHVHYKVEDIENKREAIETKFHAINTELGYYNDISVSNGVKHMKIKGREVVQNFLIQI